MLTSIVQKPALVNTEYERIPSGTGQNKRLTYSTKGMSAFWPGYEVTAFSGKTAIVPFCEEETGNGSAWMKGYPPHGACPQVKSSGRCTGASEGEASVQWQK